MCIVELWTIRKHPKGMVYVLYNTNMKMRDVLESPEAKEIVDRFLPGVTDGIRQVSQAWELSLAQMVKYSAIPEGETLLSQLNQALNVLNTPENYISPSERKLVEQFQSLHHTHQQQNLPVSHHQNAIFPGKPWLDTQGNRIQAHGGSVYYEAGVYYWYGENKEYTDGKNGVWTWGIKVYASRDLYNWKDLGYLIPPNLADPNHPMFPAKRIDRPHILRCPYTGKYVCWIKLSGAEAAFCIWQADALLGPYTLIKNLYYPGGHKAGDFDLVTDTETGIGYLFFDADHAAMLCMELTEDYLGAKEEVSRSYICFKPPFTREAPALFAYHGKKYMLTSGMTGYVPNASDCAVADSWKQPFESLGNPHIEDPSMASFNSQISCVFPVAGKEDLFVVMADRWLPEYPLDAKLAQRISDAVASATDHRTSGGECPEMEIVASPEKANTSIADYVWLPIYMKENEMPVIAWQDSWTIT